MNWREKIEALIAEIDTYTDCDDGHVFRTWRDTMQSLLDVAVAANKLVIEPCDSLDEINAHMYEIDSALDKLREAGDE